MRRVSTKIGRICGPWPQCVTATLGLFFLRRLALSAVIGAALLFTGGLMSDVQAHGIHAGAVSQFAKADGATTASASDTTQDISKIDCGVTCCPTVGCASAVLIPAQVFPAAIASDGVFGMHPHPSIKASPQASLMRPPQV